MTIEQAKYHVIRKAIVQVVRSEMNARAQVNVTSKMQLLHVHLTSVITVTIAGGHVLLPEVGGLCKVEA